MRIAILSVGLFVACTGATPPADPPAEPETPPVETPAETPAEAPAGDAAAGDEAGGEADEAPGVTLPDAALLEKAQGLARAMMPKDAMMTAVTPVLGEPASASDAEAVWIAKDGDKCKALKVTLMGDMVGSASVEDAECPKADGATE